MLRLRSKTAAFIFLNIVVREPAEKSSNCELLPKRGGVDPKVGGCQFGKSSQFELIFFRHVP